MIHRRVLAVLPFALLLAAAAPAEPVRIGMLTTLSTEAGYLGEEIRDGFLLAVEREGGRLGGIPVEVLVEDDAREPERGRQVADRLMRRDGVKLMTGIVFSNVAVAVVPRVARAGTIYLSANAGPSQLAGSGCHENYFNVAWQNDNLHEVMGKYLSEEGFDRVYLLAPNYPAGKDSLEGFKRFYTGEVIGEVYTQLGQTDYAAELASLRAAAPDAVFFFLPGGMGINFIKQYSQAGLGERIPLFGPAFSFDERLLQAVGDAALGVKNGSHWNHDLDVAANREFVEAFRAAYGRWPTLYASQGYDTARLIGSALAATGGRVDDLEALRAALRRAEFDSVRGSFRFGPNQHPVQDIYVREVVRTEDGRLTNRLERRVFTEHADAYAPECRL
jgi:branched-chain amino acid transport system substrate-binding protein